MMTKICIAFLSRIEKTPKPSRTGNHHLKQRRVHG